VWEGECEGEESITIYRVERVDSAKVVVKSVKDFLTVAAVVEFEFEFEFELNEKNKATKETYYM
jgi:hypothetical protein